jgi:simple sugar transport system ATP-binding protein
MRDEGHSVLLISHKLSEVFSHTDRVTVLRKGRVVTTLRTQDTSAGEITRAMMGAEPETRTAHVRPAPGAAALTLDQLTVANDRGGTGLLNVSFTLHQGEILGVAGVGGNGQRELAQALTGMRPALAGRLLHHGENLLGQSPRALAKRGLAHIPEDRHKFGTVPSMTVSENLALRRFREAPFSRGSVLQPAAFRTFATEVIRDYNVSAPSPEARTSLLSGGNIQKLVLARELSTQPGIIIAAHPTYGLDLGATRQIHELLLEKRDAGAGVLLISEDLEEIFALSDRIAVLFRGELMGIVPANETTYEAIGLWMAGKTS